MKLTVAILASVALAGCEKNLLQDLPDAPATVDASTNCPTPAQPLAAGTVKLYLNTEGVTLAMGSDDSRTNITSLVAASGTVVPAFLPGVAGRDAFIAQIVSIAQDALAPYSVDIVTTRPATGHYFMFVLGGPPPNTCAGCASRSLFSCATITRDAVDLMYDWGQTTATPTGYAYSILSDFGALVGLVATTKPGDCMCRFDTGCQPGPTDSASNICVYGSAVPTTKAGNGGVLFNCGRAVQDEPVLLEQNVGCR